LISRYPWITSAKREAKTRRHSDITSEFDGSYWNEGQESSTIQKKEKFYQKEKEKEKQTLLQQEREKEKEKAQKEKEKAQLIEEKALLQEKIEQLEKENQELRKENTQLREEKNQYIKDTSSIMQSLPKRSPIRRSFFAHPLSRHLNSGYSRTTLWRNQRTYQTALSFSFLEQRRRMCILSGDNSTLMMLIINRLFLFIFFIF
jgi:chromosome segregation ATPase